MIYTRRFESPNLDMELTRGILQSAAAPLELRNLAAKIALFTILPFLMIAAFEAIVINLMARVFIKLAISGLNCFYSLCTNTLEPLPLPPPRATVVLQQQPDGNVIQVVVAAPEIELPEIGLAERNKIAHVVQTIATASYWSLWREHKERLDAIDRELIPVHPFQFLEAIFGRTSTVKHHMPAVMNRWKVDSEFIGGLEKSIARTVHREKIYEYLPSFAKKVGSTPEFVQSYLLPEQNWRGLTMHLIELTN